MVRLKVLNFPTKASKIRPYGVDIRVVPKNININSAVILVEENRA